MDARREGGVRLAAYVRALALVSTLAVPAAVVMVLVDVWTGTAFLLGAAAALAGAMGAGRRAARAALPLLVVGGALGTVTSGTGGWIALVTVLAAVAGLASARGAMPACSMAALAAVVAPAASTPWAAVVYAFGLTVGAVHGLLLADRLGLPAPPADIQVPPVLAAAVLGGTAGLAAAIAHVVGDPRADWIPMTVLVVAGTSIRGSRDRIADRVVGTLVGVGVAVGLGVLGLPGGVLAGAGVMAMVGSVAVAGTSYRWTSVLVTLAVVLVAAPGASVPDIAARRLGYTVAGAVVLAAGAVAARILLPRMQRPDDDSA